MSITLACEAVAFVRDTENGATFSVAEFLRHTDIPITLEEAWVALDGAMRATRRPCSACDGTGGDRFYAGGFTTRHDCDRCGGDGSLDDDQPSLMPLGEMACAAE